MSCAASHDRQAKFLGEEIEAVLASLPSISSLYDLVKNPLAKSGEELTVNNEHSRPWNLLPLMVCEAISGDYGQAIPAAAALQLLRTAAGVFDDIEDADSSESLLARYGSAVATNVATTLVMMAEKAIVRLEARGVEPRIIVRIMDVVNSYHIAACAGQHLDISLTAETGILEDMYLKVIGMKSAYASECACHVGALLANTNQELVDTFSAFGHNLGMAAQIANDIQGITNGTDILKRKITLPVIYALAQTDSEVHQQLELAFSKETEPAPELGQTRDLLFRTGAIHYATLQMELYNQRALDALAIAEKAGASTERLKLFVT